MRPRKDTEASTEPFGDDCPYCVKNDETLSAEGARKRQAHYLRLAGSEGLEALRLHLVRWMHRWYVEDPDRARTGVQCTMAWITGLVASWSGLVDEHTGAPLAWWEARQRAHATPTQGPTTRSTPPERRTAVPRPLVGAALAATETAVADYDDEPWPEPLGEKE